MKHLLLASAALTVLAACSPAPKSTPKAAAESVAASASAAVATMVAPKDIPAGEYKTDPSHSSLTFMVNHLGFSHYTAHFTKIDATLTLDPAKPEAASLSVSIDPKSLVLNAPPKGFHEELLGAQWLDAAKFPQITFKSTKVEKTGDYTAKVTGDLTLHGVTKPVALDVTFNGGYKGMAGMDPQARAGFSASGVLKRSDFGVSYGVPAPGTNMGVSDEVAFSIETEMLGPKLAN